MIQFSSIRHQILLFGTASLLAVTLAIIGYGYFSNQALRHEVHTSVLVQAQEQVIENINLAAQHEALKIKTAFDHAMDIATSVAGSLFPEAPGLTRIQINSMLKNLVENNHDILGIYTGWEADKFDGSDAENTDNKYSQSDGKFAPYWTRSASGKIDIQALSDFYTEKLTPTGVRNSEWYLCPMESRSPCVVDPASYKVQGVDTLLSSFVAPIIRKNSYVGMVGVDYSLNFLQQLAIKAAGNLYGGAARVIILSPRGLVSADSTNKANISKVATSTDITSLISARQKQQTVINDTSIITSKTFAVTGTDASWEILIKVPKNMALAKASAIVEQLESGFASNLNGQLIVSFIAAFFGMLLIWFMSGSIYRPIRELVDVVANLTQSGGDLTQEIKIKRSDETGQLATHLNTFIANVRSIVSDVANSMGELTLSAERNAALSESGRDKISQQQMEIEQVVTATNEMSSTAHSVSDNAQVTADSVSTTQESVSRGQEVVQANAEGLQSLSEQMEHASNEIIELEKQTESIGSILDVIRNISEQTNLLALNAAIEAARAGEQGRGFAVVADEVRVLATRTADSTDEIQQMIDALRNKSKQAVNTMSQSKDLSQTCLTHAKQAVIELDEVNKQSSKIQDMAHQIASAAEEQAAVTEEVNRNIVAINDAAESLAQGAVSAQEESKSSASLVDEVNEKINHFRY
ncbi:methyl-accepting chemotaxis protein [Shewanella violacea]|uniref:Methyl-accepting chemotaxis protein n=1 Tax=Shewanella violacea (strain JCM 10179 / CIP 106290 / LMG 19151 / DSS12) TaxID=637905 RepID=D4ZFS7_SHEVD|nr:methyl-accepting chemotaxis protein [Shewanella violacea]BAJ00526.1 methyl-accepting chemotaxis protein [Shewanella violacea DSS12]